ncbi:MAG TPA: gas vesicle protein GvpJ [Vicinamibacterales bacterium]|nr:gas vesicle protein GvpJ [Vicinamibacterales bacterium]
MPRKRVPATPRVADLVLASPESSVLDLLDRLLDKGAMVNGDLTLGLAGVDLVYVRLSALICASDRVLPVTRARARERRRSRPSRLRA